MFWLVQGIGVLTTLVTVLSLIQKEKWKIMLYLSFSNVLLIITYILTGNTASSILCVGAFLRTIVYFTYSKCNKKPNIYVLIGFLAYFTTVFIIFWQSYVDLLMLLNLSMLTYTTWQDNTKLLRYGYIVSSILLATFDILVGAYTTAISDILLLISAICGVIKYKEKPTDNQKPTLPTETQQQSQI